MIDREAIANHLYRRGAWTLDVCRKVAEEIVALAPDEAVEVDAEDDAYRAWLKRSNYPHTKQRQLAFSYGYRAARSRLDVTPNKGN